MMSTRLNARIIDPKDPLVKSRPTINPYLESFWSVFDRLIWDFNPESWRSRRKVRSWKDRFPAQKAVILCNGPSLLKSDLSLLEGTFCFGLNKINLLFETSRFRPTCIVAVNPFVIEQNCEFFNETPIPLFLNSYALRSGSVKSRENISFIHVSNGTFARDCSVSIFEGYTVTYVAMQLAFHMGFRKIALVGADHDFVVDGPPNMAIESDDVDKNHFDPRYFSGGMKWHLPDLLESEISYIRAKKFFEGFGGKIVNATEGGKLEIFERQSLKAFIFNY